MTFAVKPSDWALLSPELFLTAGGLIILALSVFLGKAKEEFIGFLSVLFAAITGALVIFVSTLPDRAKPILGGAFVVDNFSLFFKGLMEGRFPGKIVIFPQISGLPLTGIAELTERHPDVAARLGPGGVWTPEAEQALIEQFWRP